MNVARSLALCAIVFALVAGCGGSAGPVANPDSPQRVVAAYIAAVNAHDFRRARHLMTAEWAQTVQSEVDGWVSGNVISLTHVRIRKPYNSPFDARQRHYRDAVTVPVRFDLQQQKVDSMGNGTQPWSYILVRNSPHQRWLITDEGLG